jgi:hypothetical protein
MLHGELAALQTSMDFLVHATDHAHRLAKVHLRGQAAVCSNPRLRNRFNIFEILNRMDVTRDHLCESANFCARHRIAGVIAQDRRAGASQHLNFGPHIPFAGAKQSGIGVEWSDHGLAEFTQLSVVNEAL